ncbi:MAG: MFS transporter [Lautropia sp.]|nr:MFS transporter [Lautropia sp.]
MRANSTHKPGLWQTYGQVFASRRIAAMLLLGFSSGLPLALTAGALQAWLTVEGISLRTIGYFALVGLPYTFKFVWAPLLDRFEPPLLGRRRGWVLLFQLGIALGCFAMARLDPQQSVSLIAALAVLMAWLSASQDVVFDAYRADLLTPEERGAGAAVSVLGYRLAMLVSGGGALMLADTRLGWPGTYQLMGVCFVLLMLATVWSPALPKPAGPRSSATLELRGFLAMVGTAALVWWIGSQLIDWLGAVLSAGTLPVHADAHAGAHAMAGGLPAGGQSIDPFVSLGLETALMLLTGFSAVLMARRVGFPSFVEPWDAFFVRRRAMAFLLLIVLYKLGDAFAGSLSTSFLLRGPGFSQTEIGAINKGLGLLATIVGALLGGAWLSSRSLYGALMAFGLLQALSNLGYWLLAVLPKSYSLMVLAIGVENLCGGLGTAAFVAFLMALTDRRFSAAQYALLSALAAVGRVYVGPVAGVAVEHHGWASFFLMTVVAAVPGLLMLWWLRREVRALDDEGRRQRQAGESGALD